MKMDGDIRVKISSKYNDLYNGMKGLVINDFHELFYLCVCLGFKNKKRTNLKSAEDKFWSKTFTKDEYSVFYSIMLSENECDFSSINEDKKVIKVMEEYADAGMDILINEVMPEYTINNANKIDIDKTISKDLVKNILFYIYDDAKDINFYE